jgi:hypothetical protein
VGFYIVKYIAQAKQEGLSQIQFRFLTEWFCKNDPKGLVPQHASQVSSCWPYAHENFEDDIFIECSEDWEEILQRKSKPNMTRFKAMSMDEQVETIGKLVQEALRVREEIKATKTIEVQRRVLLLLEGVQRVID